MMISAPWVETLTGYSTRAYRGSSSEPDQFCQFTRAWLPFFQTTEDRLVSIAIRMTIDTSRSSVVWKNGSQARVNWQNWSGSDEEPLYALVEYPVNVSTQGAEIIIDFDVGRSFLYNFYGAKEFILMPQIRAINSAATGTIAGSVTSDYTGATRPIANANVTLCGGAACEPPNAYIV